LLNSVLAIAGRSSVSAIACRTANREADYGGRAHRHLRCVAPLALNTVMFDLLKRGLPVANWIWFRDVELATEEAATSAASSE